SFEATLSRSSGYSPKVASLTGASIPAAAWVAPSPGSGSSTVTERPVAAARQARLAPMIPQPTTTTSAWDSFAGTRTGTSLRWHDPDQVDGRLFSALSAP